MMTKLVRALSLALLATTTYAAQSPQIPIAGSSVPQFAQPISTLSASPQNSTMRTVMGNQPLTLRMCEFRSNVLPPATVPGYQGTWVWGYLVDPTGSSTCSQLTALYGDANGVLDTYLGPVIVNQRGGASTDVTFVNDLGNAATTRVLAYKYSSDQTLHWADPLDPWSIANPCMNQGGIPAFGSPCAQNYSGPIAAVPHLHGGEVPAEIDGSPDSWYTSNGIYRGHKYYSFGGAAPNAALYRYPNTQEAGPLWFHDHTLGATRLNVYAGLAGGYFIYDPSLNLPANLTPLNEVVPLVIQDRMFDTNGQLFFEAAGAGEELWAPNPEHPYWSPEFIGDTIVVNGKAWPYINVEPRRYRFLFLNGSNARTYEMFLQTAKKMGPSLWIIGTDGGYLDAPVRIDPNGKGSLQRLLMMPGERYEAIVDFAGYAPGTLLTLRNIARSPYPGGDTPNGNTTGRIVQFRIGVCASGRCGANDTSYDPAGGGSLRPAGRKIVRLVDPASGTLAAGVTPAKTRQLTLNEILGDPISTIDPVSGVFTNFEGGPLEILVNNTLWSGESARAYGDFTPISVNGVMTAFSEMPAEGQTEVWEIVNLTADAHPIHLHLVQFQVINRQAFDVRKYDRDYGAAFPGVSGNATCPPESFLPGYGPPLDYRAANNPLSGGKYGGNPDVTPYLKGPLSPAAANEAGWKDTVMMKPGEVTRIAVRWAPTDLPVGAPATSLFYPFDPSGGNNAHLFNYVWHCHIIDHEDNEMMRPSAVVLNGAAPVPASRLLRQGTNY